MTRGKPAKAASRRRKLRAYGLDGARAGIGLVREGVSQARKKLSPAQRSQRAAPAAQDVFREKLTARMKKEIADLIAKAPDSVVAEALSQSTPFASLATTVARSVYAESTITDDDRVLQAARASGAKYKMELLKRAGGAYNGKQFAEAINRTRQAVHEGRLSNRYFAVSTTDGVAYPKLQLTKDGLLPGLREFLEAFEVQDRWTQLMVLIEPSDRLDGKSPLAALRAGNREGAIAVAASYGQHGA